MKYELQIRNQVNCQLVAIVSLIVLTTVIQGCMKADWYDVKTEQTLTIPVTLKDFQALLDNADFINTSSPALGEIASDGHYAIESKISEWSYDHNAFNAYTWSHLNPYQKVLDWSNGSTYGAYPKIFYCNLVLEGLTKIMPEGPEETLKWKNIKGQALFHRARSHYELTQIFAPTYNSASASDELGIPLKLESDINLPAQRASVRQSYDQIIADLQQAKQLLPIQPQYKTRPGLPAVYGLLSRIYLSMEEYKKAGEYADSCLDYYEELLDFNQLDSNSAVPFSIFNEEVIFQTIMYGSLPLVPGMHMLIEPELYNLYDSNDLRRGVFFNKVESSGDIVFEGNYGGLTDQHFTGIASDEILLIRAECLAREGNQHDAMETLNKLLVTRYSTGQFTPFEAANSEEALTLILKERKKELLLRGLRWSDLRRLNRDPRFGVTLTRTINGATYSIKPNEYKYTFPIPDDIVAMTGIQQNPGW